MALGVRPNIDREISDTCEDLSGEFDSGLPRQRLAENSVSKSKNHAQLDANRPKRDLDSCRVVDLLLARDIDDDDGKRYSH